MKKWIMRIALFVVFVSVIFVGFSFIRLKLAQNEIQGQDQSHSPAATTVPLSIGETQTFELLPLYEAASLEGLENGHGVSYLIRTDSTTILFDLGYNLNSSPSPLEKNMAALGISLADIDTLVLSHRHPDHVGGQKWWNANTFSVSGNSQPALAGLSIYVPEAMEYPGSTPVLSTVPVHLAGGVATTGTMTYAQPFPIWLSTPTGDEQSLAVNIHGKGIVLITGCGHMGLKTLLERAQATFDVPVVGVIGGLHYGNASADTLQTEIQLLRELNPVIVALSPHDSNETALEAFAQAFPEAYQDIQVGEPIRLP